MCAAWVICLALAIALIANSWLALSTPVPMYFLLKCLIQPEERYLENTFGDAYRIYQRRVPAIWPVRR
jgi:protein-S-isoprenylcysteine O-methyltransferase Ste14